MIFEKRRSAILFMLLMIVSAVNLVGTRDNAGALAHVERQVTTERAAFDEAVDGMSQEDEPERNSTGFSREEELVDFADGIDPSPPEGDEDQSATAEPEVTLVEPAVPDEQGE